MGKLSVAGVHPDWDFDDGPESLKLVAVAANDTVVWIRHAFGCHRYDQCISQ